MMSLATKEMEGEDDTPIEEAQKMFKDCMNQIQKETQQASSHPSEPVDNKEPEDPKDDPFADIMKNINKATQ